MVSRIRLAATLSLSTLALAVGGCGGSGSGVVVSPPPTGGGGGTPTPSPTPTPTPTPTPPPTGVNDDLLAPLASESFTNLAALANVTYQKSDGSRLGSSSAASATIIYNAANNSYALTVNGRSQTFTSSQISTALSTPQQVVYLIDNGSTVDTLALTRPGTSGPLTYQYVGSAFWQRTSDTTATIGGSLDGIVYGVVSPSGDIPSTGSAFYGFDVVGAGSHPDDVFNLSGTGNAVVNFADGEMVFSGQLVSATSVGNNFGSTLSGTAQIASGANAFSGQFTLAGAASFNGSVEPLVFNGPLNGKFFGPDAAELGAVLRSSSSNTGVDAMVATILGRKGEAGQNTSFADPLDLQGQSFLAQAKQVTFDSNGQSGPASIQSTNDDDLPVLLVPAAQQFTFPTYTFVTPDGLQTISVHPPQNGVQNSAGEYAGLRSLDQRSGWLQYQYSDYANLGRLVDYDNGTYTFTDFLFGFDTPAANLPTGEARYQIDVNSFDALYFGPNLAPTVLGGQGRITVDFASGILGLDAALYDTNTPTPTGFNGAGLSGTAALGAGTSKFTGTVQVNGASVMTGTWEGGIFGPDGAELAAIFAASAGDELLTGAFSSGLDTNPVANISALADLTVQTTFNDNRNGILETGGSPAVSYGNSGDFQVVFDPVAGTYSFIVDRDPVLETTPAEFGPAGVDAGASDASFAVYQTADGNGDLRILKNADGNPTIELTYATFGQLSYRRVNNAQTLQNEYFFAFGNRTANDQLPLSGFATYSGVALGAGNVDGLGEVDVEGTMTAEINFGTIDVTTALTLMAIDRDGLLPNLDLGTIEVDGQRFGSQILQGVRTTETGDFGIAGWFYGPNAEEIAGVWQWQRDPFGTWTVPFEVQGVFGATKDP